MCIPWPPETEAGPSEEKKKISGKHKPNRGNNGTAARKRANSTNFSKIIPLAELDAQWLRAFFVLVEDLSHPI